VTGRKRKALRQAGLEAFDEIVNTYEGPLLRYVSRLVSGSDAAQDVVQNTFIRLFRRWHDAWCPGPRISAWLYRVAHNCAVDHLRRETKRRELHKRHAEESETAARPDRGEGFRVSEAAEKAAAALHALSLREQQLVILKVYEEKSYREISEITGLTVSNVGYILHHAMKRLAAELTPETGT
jgi:RNA polymerase sigma-70 factor (ECF subfamily)